jgi:hypothetical protein
MLLASMIGEEDHGKIVKAVFVSARFVAHDPAANAHSSGGDQAAAHE